MRERRKSKTYRTISEEEAEEAQGAYRLGLELKRELVRCPRCHKIFDIRKRHWGSDFCLVHTTRRLYKERGWCVVNGGYRRIVEDAGIALERAPGGFIDKPGEFRSKAAEDRWFGPAWVMRVLRRVGGLPRSDRVQALKSRKAAEDANEGPKFDRKHYPDYRRRENKQLCLIV